MDSGRRGAITIALLIEGINVSDIYIYIYSGASTFHESRTISSGSMISG